MRNILLVSVLSVTMALTACIANDRSLKINYEQTQSSTPKDLSNDYIDVYRLDGSVQCTGDGMSLEQMKSLLQDISIYAMSKGRLNQAYPTVCGGETGKINIYRVAKKDLSQVLQLGFEILPKN